MNLLLWWNSTLVKFFSPLFQKKFCKFWGNNSGPTCAQWPGGVRSRAFSFQAGSLNTRASKENHCPKGKGGISPCTCKFLHWKTGRVQEESSPFPLVLAPLWLIHLRFPRCFLPFCLSQCSSPHYPFPRFPPPPPVLRIRIRIHTCKCRKKWRWKI